jgi:glycosyltransferase involved in cell wall biosynthesis
MPGPPAARAGNIRAWLSSHRIAAGEARWPLRRVLVVGPNARSLVDFRGELIASIARSGADVTAMSADDGGASTSSTLAGFGAVFRPYPVKRSGTNPVDDLNTARALRSVLAQVRPDVVLAYAIKPVIWCGLALRSMQSRARFFAMITGLGLAFRTGGVKQAMLTRLATSLYRASLVRAEKVIFHNPDDRGVFVDRRLAEPGRCVVVRGSGVNVTRFAPAPFPQGPLVFLMIARLLGGKGVREYAAAATMVRKRHPEARFLLVGPEDPSPDGIPLKEVQGMAANGGVEYLGATSDVRPFLEQCHVYVLPSYHEGTPRTVLEAMAMGRPVITTDVPGCRETVVDGDNGLLVAVRDAGALAAAMLEFIRHPEAAPTMGKRGRHIAEERFDVRKINDDMLRILGLAADRVAS